MRLDGEHAYLVQALHEQLAVLSIHDGLDRSAKHLHSVFFKHAAAVEFHAAVEGGLASEGQEDALRALLRYYLFDEKRGYWQEIDTVGDSFRSLDGSDVGVDQDRLHAVFAQGLESLCTGVVELPGLAYLEGA